MTPAPDADAPTLRAPRAQREAASAARAAVSSGIATLVDGLAYQAVLFAATAMHHRAYVAAAMVGAVGGGVTNFSLNRHWAFRAECAPLAGQAARYALGSLMTLLVLEGLLWILVERVGIDARTAWLPAKLLAWGAFSYPFQRIVVFAGASR